jgi:hypothetical protein
MPKTLDTATFTIGSLLGRYERRRAVLPEFQRSFSWEKVHVATFWDDLVLFEKQYARSPSTATYFLGPIVLIEHEDSLLLLDGQQRLATATITFAALRDVARILDKSGGTKASDLARDIQRELIEKDTDPVTYSLTLSELDEPYFLKAIKADPPTIPHSRLRSHALIQNAYTHSVERLNAVVKGKSLDEALRIMKSLRDALAKGITLVGMIVQSEDDAYTILETLNDRGLRLSVPDLVLNLLMRRAPDGTARKLVRQYWNAVLRELGRRDVSRFLRHLWVSRYGDIKAEGLFTAIKKELEAAKLDSVTFAEQCADECDDYVALMDANIPLPSKEGLTNLEGIVRYLQVPSAPPLLLAGYRCLSPQHFEKLLSAIITTHIRYVIVSNKNPLDVESRFFEAARTIRQLSQSSESSGKQLQVAEAKLKELTVTDATVEQGADELLLERSEAVWLMTRLANSMQSQTKEVGMDKANLEHVFPQNPTTAAWPNAASLEPLIWHIGNLTILGEKLNRKAQNRAFTDKATRYYAKSEIELTKRLLKYPAWDEKAILGRGEDLAKEIAKLWPAL